MSRQSSRRNRNRLRLHRSYTTTELAEVLEVHRRTVQGWRKGGLSPIDENDRPMLFLGSTVRLFLKARQSSKKCPLLPHEVYCLRCSTGVAPEPDSVEVHVTERQVGKDAVAITIRGRCSRCRSKVVRFASSKTIYDTSFWTKLRRPDNRLIGTSTPLQNTDVREA